MDKTKLQLTGLQTALVYAVPLALVMLIYWPSLVLMAGIWDVDPNYSHGYLIPVLCVVFAVISWRRSGAQAVRTEVPGDEAIGGIIAIVAGLMLHAICMVLGNMVIDVLSMIFVIRGILDLIGGRQTKRIFSFATIFLIFMAPLPQSWYLPLAGGLQQLAAVVSENVFDMCGVAVYREGYMIHLPNCPALEVGAACSGLRSLMAVFALAAAISFFGHDRSRWYRLSIVLLGPVIAVLANCIRVILTGVISMTLGAEYATGAFHEAEGMVMIVIAAVLLLAIASQLARLDEYLTQRKQGQRNSNQQDTEPLPADNASEAVDNDKGGSQ